MVKLLVFILISISIFGQGQPSITPGHSVVINWSDAQNPLNTKYYVYRLVGSCPGSAPSPPGVLNGFILLNAASPITNSTASPTALSSPPLSGMNYIDVNVQGGLTYCYFVVAFSNTGYAPASVMVSATIPGMFAVSGISATVQ